MARGSPRECTEAAARACRTALGGGLHLQRRLHHGTARTEKAHPDQAGVGPRRGRPPCATGATRRSAVHPDRGWGPEPDAPDPAASCGPAGPSRRAPEGRDRFRTNALSPKRPPPRPPPPGGQTGPGGPGTGGGGRPASGPAPEASAAWPRRCARRRRPWRGPRVQDPRRCRPPRKRPASAQRAQGPARDRTDTLPDGRGGPCRSPELCPRLPPPAPRAREATAAATAADHAGPPDEPWKTADIQIQVVRPRARRGVGPS